VGYLRHGCTDEQDARSCEARSEAAKGGRLLQRGVKPAEVARWLKVSRTSVCRWEQALAVNGRRDGARCLLLNRACLESGC
jgi:hypothetical protein